MHNMESYDVIVVGAGPAGSIAAKNLANQGHRVLILDKAKFPRDKVCAGGLTKEVIELHPELEKYTYNKYSRVQIFGDKTIYPLRYERKDGLGYQTTREYFDYMLVKDAISAGVIFKELCKANNVRIEPNGVIVETTNGKYGAKMVLGADGANSIVARKTDLKKYWSPKEIATNIRVQVELPEDLILKFAGPEYTLTFFGRVRGTPGIGYIFPKRNYLNVGICTLTPDRLPLKQLLNSFIEQAVKKGIIPNFNSTNNRGAIYPICGPIERFHGNRTLLLGDAAGFVNPFDGEGVFFAIYSADIAAEITSQALRDENFSAEYLAKYRVRCMKSFGNYLKKATKVAKFVWKYLDTFVKYAPYSQNVMKLYRKALNVDQHLYWTVMKLILYFIGAILKFHLRREYKLMPVIQI